jgi:chromosomal replication initiation ATPase DnaA
MVGRVENPLHNNKLRQLPLEFEHTPAHGEDDFLVGAGNALAHGRISAWPHWPEAVTVLIGPASSGKSHLARIFESRTGAEVVTPETIASVAALDRKGPLVIEDVDRLGYDEPSLFHLLNQAMRGNRTLLLTAREEIADWPLQTDDVRSRVRRAPAFRLDVTDDIELSQMFAKLFGDRQIKVDPKIIHFLVSRMERSTEEVAILVDSMDRMALARGTAITRTIASEALALRHDESDGGDEQDWDLSSDE